MADVIKTTYELKLENLFVDGDTRTITLKNPRNDLAESDIESLNTWMQTNKIIIGDKDGADFDKISRAIKVTKITQELDLE